MDMGRDSRAGSRGFMIGRRREESVVLTYLEWKVDARIETVLVRSGDDRNRHRPTSNTRDPEKEATTLYESERGAGVGGGAGATFQYCDRNRTEKPIGEIPIVNEGEEFCEGPQETWRPSNMDLSYQ